MMPSYVFLAVGWKPCCIINYSLRQTFQRTRLDADRIKQKIIDSAADGFSVAPEQCLAGSLAADIFDANKSSRDRRTMTLRNSPETI